MAENRVKRESTTREATVSKKSWRLPSLLAYPDPEPGYRFYYVRIATLGVTDATNINSKLDEGWIPCKAEDYPSLVHSVEDNPRFPDSIVTKGLMLCKMPEDMVMQRDQYYQSQTDGSMQSVDSHFMRENDPRAPLFTERKSSVSFGKGA